MSVRLVTITGLNSAGSVFFFFDRTGSLDNWIR